MTNERLFAQATKVAIENKGASEQLRTIMFLEGDTKKALFRVEYAVDGCEDYRVLDVRVEVEPLLSYKHQLGMANAYGISPTRTMIAEEVYSFDCFKEEDDYTFEKACELVSETYFGIDDCNSIAYCALVIASLFEHYTISCIEDMLPRERIATYEELC